MRETNDPVTEQGEHKPKHLHFESYPLDYYSFAFDVTIEPQYWVILLLRFWQLTWKWEYHFKKR